jgi:hypothetical protein
VFLALLELHARMKVILLQIYAPLEHIEDLLELMVFLVLVAPRAHGQRTGICVMKTSVSNAHLGSFVVQMV